MPVHELGWSREADQSQADLSPGPRLFGSPELERSLITERTRAGVKAAQRRGVKFGRKAKLTPGRLALARKLIDHDDKTPTEAAKIMGVSRSTVYRALQRTAA